jgi:hypothetical protein
MAYVSEKRFNPVERSAVLTELIHKEERRIHLSEDFSVPDPRRMTLLPAKPNATTPAAQPSAQQLEAAEATLSRLAGIKHAHQVPTQVHALPVTSNMEVRARAALVAAAGAGGRAAAGGVRRARVRPRATHAFAAPHPRCCLATDRAPRGARRSTASSPPPWPLSCATTLCLCTSTTSRT